MGLAEAAGWHGHLRHEPHPMARITHFHRNGHGLMTLSVYLLLAALALAMTVLGW